MKPPFILLFIAALAGTPCFAQTQPTTTAAPATPATTTAPATPAATTAPIGRRGRGPAGPPITVTADHSDWNYVPGESVKFTITAPAALVLTPSAVNGTCGNANGQTSVTVTGGTGAGLSLPCPAVLGDHHEVVALATE